MITIRGTSLRSKGRKRGSGAAALELALLTPVLCMFLLGAIDYGWTFLLQSQMTNAAREGARAATTIFPGGCGSSSSISACSSPGSATAGSGTSWGAVQACNGLPSTFPSSTVAASASCAAVTINSVTYSQYTVQLKIASFKGLIGYVALPSSLTATSIMVGPQ